MSISSASTSPSLPTPARAYDPPHGRAALHTVASALEDVRTGDGSAPRILLETEGVVSAEVASIPGILHQELHPDGQPRRPMNAFMIFARHRRPVIQAKEPGLKTGEISKRLSHDWKNLLEADKAHYLHQAKILKDEFHAKFPDYVYKRKPNNTGRRKSSLSLMLAEKASAASRGNADESSPLSPDQPPSSAGIPPYSDPIGREQYGAQRRGMEGAGEFGQNLPQPLSATHRPSDPYDHALPPMARPPPVGYSVPPGAQQPRAPPPYTPHPSAPSPHSYARLPPPPMQQPQGPPSPSPFWFHPDHSLPSSGASPTVSGGPPASISLSLAQPDVGGATARAGFVSSWSPEGSLHSPASLHAGHPYPSPGAAGNGHGRNNSYSGPPSMYRQPSPAPSVDRLRQTSAPDLPGLPREQPPYSSYESQQNHKRGDNGIDYNGHGPHGNMSGSGPGAYVGSGSGAYVTSTFVGGSGGPRYPQQGRPPPPEAFHGYAAPDGGRPPSQLAPGSYQPTASSNPRSHDGYYSPASPYSPLPPHATAVYHPQPQAPGRPSLVGLSGSSSASELRTPSEEPLGAKADHR